MISHKHKCIFIHIPRTGGTSFEHALFGGNWWGIEKETKHILASQAKRFYSEYWDNYFKFAIVRNPWDRCVSLLNFSSIYYGERGNFLTNEKIEWYKCKYGYPIIVEYDYRFYDRKQVLTPNHEPGQVYGNIIDEEVDFIARFERLEEDFLKICSILDVKNKKLPKTALSPNRKQNYQYYYDDYLRELVSDIYKKDIERFDYSFY